MRRFLVLLFVQLVVISAERDDLEFIFRRVNAVGIKGEIDIDYKTPPRVEIEVDLNMEKIDWEKIQSAHKDCKKNVTSWQWQLHVDYASSSKSASLQQCDKTGGIYDPDFVCGPNSQHVTNAKCAAKQTNACTPAAFKNDPKVCAKGDLSGKFGQLEADANGKIKMKFADRNFPTEKEAKKNWSIVLKPVCSSTNSPKVACAQVQFDKASCVSHSAYSTSLPLLSACFVLIYVAML